ncbi:Shedu anti-phage system protein SduA domain-containing protein [Pectobacterium jejuense]|uniref:Shedu anti-phage system protein SduA domain-containing protein n=1 Tax=Pectobacterium jejuense TaxID=2974022 RepID=UPI00227E59A8|nr:Shedu anti-phage system protein SduA domain-containing protein [Pectobacterium jejuense]MCY9850386.1 DUF4263 domain-containing protein [Pectobacterium jejuense]
MKGFHQFEFDANKLATEFTNLEKLLQKGKGISLEENKHLSPAFKAAPNHISIIASAFGGVNKPDLIASEYWILDKLRCDFAVCDSRKRKFCFIEIENASPKSIFVERKPDQYNGLLGRAPYYDWSARFEHGASQIIDWIRVLKDAEKTDDFRAHFGSANKFEAEFILVIGRDEYLDDDQKERLAWRTKNLRAGDYKIRCITFDQVIDEVEYEFTTYVAAAKAAVSTDNE